MVNLPVQLFCRPHYISLTKTIEERSVDQECFRMLNKIIRIDLNLCCAVVCILSHCIHENCIALLLENT